MFAAQAGLKSHQSWLLQLSASLLLSLCLQHRLWLGVGSGWPSIFYSSSHGIGVVCGRLSQSQLADCLVREAPGVGQELPCSCPLDRCDQNTVSIRYTNGRKPVFSADVVRHQLSSLLWIQGF